MIAKLIIALRNLKKNWFYTIINIAGLAIGLSACSFILIWVQDEKSYDRFHDHADEIYLGVAHFANYENIYIDKYTPGLFAPAAKEHFSAIKDYCRIRSYTAGYILADGKNTDEKKIYVADSNFFTFFNFPIIAGFSLELLQKPDEVVISESLAKELFGNENPIGKMIHTNGMMNFKEIVKTYYIAAVMKDFPANTSMPRADLIIPQNSDSYDFYTDWWHDWAECEFDSYIRIHKGADIQQLAKEITNLQTNARDYRYFSLQPLTNIHLYALDGSPSGIKTVWIYLWIAGAILVISCINYVNLVTGRSAKRNHEVGIKKILGARKPALFFQMMTESVILFLTALGIAFCLNILLAGVFNHFSGKEISFEWNNLNMWMLYLLLFFTVIVFAGIYPALSVSSFKLRNMLQGKLTSRGNNRFQKLLIVNQFIISFVLIATTVTLESQLTYMRRKNLGYDQEHVFTCRTRNMAGHYQTVKAELLKYPFIRSVVGTSDNLSDISSNTTHNWEGKVGEGYINYHNFYVDSTFFSNMSISFVAGSGFEPNVRDVNTGTDLGLNEGHQFVINEAAAKKMGLTEPIVGKWIDADHVRGRIVGVVKDFHFNSFHQEIAPLVFFYSPNWANTLYIRTTAQDAGKAIAAVEKLWKEFNPNYSFNYSFMDESFEHLYRSYIQTGRLFGVFSFIAILIACLGLFGLVTYKTEVKTKEIGIRKVLGANISDIVLMLTRELLILVGLAMLIAFPITYYWLDKLLQDFAYRISISWWIFAISGVIITFLTLLTVGWKAFKTSMANPVEAINKNE